MNYQFFGTKYNLWGMDTLKEFNQEELVQYHVMSMLNKTARMFDVDGLPETIKLRDLELLIQTSGYAIIVEEDGKHYALYGTLGGEPNQNYMPTIAVVANPYLKLSKTYTIGKDCVIIPNDTFYMGLLPMDKYYGKQLATTDISMDMLVVNTRAQFALLADNDNAKRSCEEFLSQLAKGKRGVLMDKSIYDKIQALPLAAQTSAQTIIQLLERTQYIKGSWLNELGVQSNYNMKRETITANENILNVDNLLPFTDNMLYSRTEAMKELERVFGLKWTYKFSSSWQKLRTEIKLTEQRDFKKGEQSNQLDNKENDNSEVSGNGKNE